MGLGGTTTESDEYEWFRLADLPRPRRGGSASRRRSGGQQPSLATRPAVAVSGHDSAALLAIAMSGELDLLPLWPAGEGTRVLLVDLDNLRADPVHWRARMHVMAFLARESDHVALAGQGGAVARARPHLFEFGDSAQAVPDGSDLADHVLLDAAEAVIDDTVHIVVVSNDGIFASLAGRGPLTVLSPGSDALSDRLRDAAHRTIDLTALERRLGAESLGG